MVRRCLCACTIVVLSLLTYSNSAVAAVRKKGNRSGVASRSESRNLRARSSKASGGCLPCAAEQARLSKGKSSRRAKTAKALPCHPKDYVDPTIARNYNAAMRDMRRAGIKPKVTSVWRSSETQAALFRCTQSSRCRRANPGLYAALPPGQSIHEAGFAVDVAGVASGPRGAKRLTPRGKRIVSIMKKNGFDWRYGLADPVHFEADPRRHGYKNIKQAIARTQNTCQVKLAKSKSSRKSVNRVAVNTIPVKARLSEKSHKRPVRIGV